MRESDLDMKYSGNSMGKKKTENHSRGIWAKRKEIFHPGKEYSLSKSFLPEKFTFSWFKIKYK
jgi:hypothetical protein